MSSSENPVDAAGRRLAEALNRLEQRLSTGGGGADPADTLFEDDRAALQAELGRERTRVQALERVAVEASAVLGRAAVEIRAAVGEPAHEDA